jgi:hypothetical protein
MRAMFKTLFSSPWRAAITVIVALLVTVIAAYLAWVIYEIFFGPGLVPCVPGPGAPPTC